ncbi:hypothetical protein F5Y07DRAFT_152039 [Xylaria sp. FL0933]|nr:hypothetical protein F5Y07DRAFT_152039 [Xylaria sp. FL0933]
MVRQCAMFLLTLVLASDWASQLLPISLPALTSLPPQQTLVEPENFSQSSQQQAPAPRHRALERHYTAVGTRRVWLWCSVSCCQDVYMAYRPQTIRECPQPSLK